MKKILGSLLILTLSLFAKSSYEWKIELDKHELYLHQSALLSMECVFSKEGKNDDVEFTPPKDVPIAFKLLNEKRHFEGAEQHIRYTYVIFAKQAGEYQLKLEPKMLFTTQSAIDNVIIGRDNVNDLEVERETAKIDPITIVVHDTASDLTGVLQLFAELDQKEVSAYEPVHLEMKISGEGNLQTLKPITFDIEGVDVFSDEPEKRLELGENGYKGVWLQRFAFVGKHDFIIPPVTLSYFDLNERRIKKLQTEAFSVSIKQKGIQRDELIDKVDLPSDKFDFKAYVDYVYYLLSFVAGFILAKLIKLPTRTPKKEKGEKIKKAHGSKELLEVLVLCDKNLFAEEIEVLEADVYKGASASVAQVKKQALSKL